MTPKPIAGYLTDFEEPAAPPAPSHAPPPAMAASPHPAAANDAVAVAPDAEAIRLEAFAAGKREGLELAEARHALERRRWENERDRALHEQMEAAERAQGERFAERLEREIAGLGERLSREAALCLAPFVRTGAERRAVDAMAADMALLPASARLALSGPPHLVHALVSRLDPALRERVRVGATAAIELRIETDDLVLQTRLDVLAQALRTA